jgi:hypothetical protein
VLLQLVGHLGLELREDVVPPPGVVLIAHRCLCARGSAVTPRG